MVQPPLPFLLRIWCLDLLYYKKYVRAAKGEGLTFYGPEEAIIAYNEKEMWYTCCYFLLKRRLMNGNIKSEEDGWDVCWSCIVNGNPDEVGFINKIISKKSLRDIIADVIKGVGVARSCDFLMVSKLGLQMSYTGGLSFNLDDIIIPKEKEELIKKDTMRWNEITENEVWDPYR